MEKIQLLTYEIGNKIRQNAETTDDELPLARVIADKLIPDIFNANTPIDEQTESKYRSLVDRILKEIRELRLSSEDEEDVGFMLLEAFRH